MITECLIEDPLKTTERLPNIPRLTRLSIHNKYPLQDNGDNTSAIKIVCENI